MAHGFSTASMMAMEPVFDRHVTNLRNKIDKHVESGGKFDLKMAISFYTYDVLGELAFSTQFNSQAQDDPNLLPPINDHIFLGCLYGSLPSLLPYSMRWSSLLPIPWLKRLIRSRLMIRDTVRKCVQKEMATSGNAIEDKNKNLLTQLIAARDPETGEQLTNMDVGSEAFGFLVAGSHTTSGTLTLLFYHLLHNPDIYHKAMEEMDRELPRLDNGTYGFTGLESKLPYSMACIRENFRLNPVFTMPLARTIMADKGANIDGEIIPKGVSLFLPAAHSTRRVLRPVPFPTR